MSASNISEHCDDHPRCELNPPMKLTPRARSAPVNQRTKRTETLAQFQACTSWRNFKVRPRWHMHDAREHSHIHACFRLPAPSACARGHPGCNFVSTTSFGLVRYISRVLSTTVSRITPGRDRTDTYLVCITDDSGSARNVVVIDCALTYVMSLGGCVWSQSRRYYVHF